jgi:3-hydroxy-9,10-secoandrosta-1,3,5(10)-triene-9,17-dione monooxygenase
MTVTQTVLAAEPEIQSGPPFCHVIDDDNWMADRDRELLARARALVPLLAAREAACSVARDVLPETIADFHRAGILRVLQPKSFGGFEGATPLFMRITEELTFGCVSSAWVFAVFAEHAWLIASFPEQAQRDVWGRTAEAVASSSLAPRSLATPVRGGYRLSGRYPFSSGCMHAQWAIAGAFCDDGHTGRHVRYMLIPISDVEILDDWNVLGLRGTGSRTLMLDDVFIPEYRSVALDDLVTGHAPGGWLHRDYEMIHLPRPLLAVFSQAPVMLSVGRRALDFAITAMRGRVSRGTIQLNESHVVQMMLGAATAEIDAATLVLRNRCRWAYGLHSLGPRVPKDEILASRRDSVFALRLVRTAVERLCEISSAELVYDTSPLQAYLRDILTMSTHFMANWEAGMVPYGRLQLGLEPPASME